MLFAMNMETQGFAVRLKNLMFSTCQLLPDYSLIKTLVWPLAIFDSGSDSSEEPEAVRFLPPSVKRFRV